MEGQLEQMKTDSVALCEKLVYDLKRNRDDAEGFFGGDVYKAYVSATERAISKAQLTRDEIRKL